MTRILLNWYNTIIIMVVVWIVSRILLLHMQTHRLKHMHNINIHIHMDMDMDTEISGVSLPLLLLWSILRWAEAKMFIPSVWYARVTVWSGYVCCIALLCTLYYTRTLIMHRVVACEHEMQYQNPSIEMMMYVYVYVFHWRNDIYMVML
jgi:hypothetical protein